MDTDWEFLIPRDNEDEGQFYANSPPDPNATASNSHGIPIVPFMQKAGLLTVSQELAYSSCHAPVEAFCWL
ncbi:hypothetical protein Sste5344_010136 [Sporothrix stenoceras]